MKPANLKTKVFLDSGDPEETKEAIKLLGFLDGQTTNPTLIAKNPDAAARLARGEKFSEREILDFYRQTVQEISGLIPEGSVSIEVYADELTTADAMLKQAREFYAWIPPRPFSLSPKGGEGGGGAHIKFPTSEEGLKAAEQAVKEGMRVNMTLCFSQEQAAAVHAATRGAKKGQVFVSPFIGRLDDRGENGMDLVKNIIRMYSTPSPTSPNPSSTSVKTSADRSGRRGIEGAGEKEISLPLVGRVREGVVHKSHVEVLTASVRSAEHILEALRLGSDIITMPFKVLKEWASAQNPKSQFSPHLSSPARGEEMKEGMLKPIPYMQLDLNKPWESFDLKHPLTDAGIEKFSADWNSLIQ
ncbi:MAG: transaldolase [Candidatus Doudnabacteria bacterium]|nr:transaldolase [Candidatus Doudnabacteria bacterium]